MVPRRLGFLAQPNVHGLKVRRCARCPNAVSARPSSVVTNTTDGGAVIITGVFLKHDYAACVVLECIRSVTVRRATRVCWWTFWFAYAAWRCAGVVPLWRHVAVMIHINVYARYVVIANGSLQNEYEKERSLFNLCTKSSPFDAFMVIV